MMPLDPNDKTNGGSSVTTGFYVLDYSDFVDFSPDGTKMAVVNGPGREASRQKSLDVIDLTANYGGGQITRPGVAVASPSWSPDGSTIAYVQQPEGPYQDTVDDRRIWLIAADGTNARRLTKGETAEERPQWSADGRFILFVRREPRASVPNFDPSPGSGISLWRHEVATGNEELLLNDIEFQVSGTGTNIGYYGHYDWDRIFDWHQ
jgi:Tol biopolymer transport system component